MMGARGACVPGRRVPPAWVYHLGPDAQPPAASQGTQRDKEWTSWPPGHSEATADVTFRVQSIIVIITKPGQGLSTPPHVTPYPSLFPFIHLPPLRLLLCARPVLSITWIRPRSCCSPAASPLAVCTGRRTQNLRAFALAAPSAGRLFPQNPAWQGVSSLGEGQSGHRHSQAGQDRARVREG